MSFFEPFLEEEFSEASTASNVKPFSVISKEVNPVLPKRFLVISTSRRRESSLLRVIMILQSTEWGRRVEPLYVPVLVKWRMVPMAHS